MDNLINKEIYKTLFKFLPVDNNLNFDTILLEILNNFNSDKEKYFSVSKLNCVDLYDIPLDLLSVLYYRIANYIYYQTTYQTQAKLISEYGNNITKIYIDCSCKIGKFFTIINGSNTKIYNGDIGENLTISGYTNIGRNKEGEIVKIGNNVTVNNNSFVFGNILIGDNSYISNNVVIKENIDENSKVEIINQYQITENRIKNLIPSQQLFVYGIIPKFKNAFIIMGDGFYNPTVLIKFKKEISLDYQITYWDKNKIIIKIKNSIPFKLPDIENHKIILLSNSNKLILINNFGIIKALLGLTKIN